MKKTLLRFLFFFMLFTPISTAYAEGDLVLPQEEATSESLTNPFEIELRIKTQSPWTKKVPIEVVFKPTIDSSRTQVAWDVPLGVTVEKKYNDFFEAQAGQTYTVEALIDPEQPGSYNIVVNITNWGYGSNVTSSERVMLNFDDSQLVTPRTAGFQTASMIRYVVILLIVLLLVVASVIGIKKGTKFLKKWLKPPQ